MHIKYLMKLKKIQDSKSIDKKFLAFLLNINDQLEINKKNTILIELEILVLNLNKNLY